MNIIRLIICIACASEILVQLLRIIWLYFPSFMQHSFIYKRKNPKKPEMVLYCISLIVAMAYYITMTLTKVF